ncbi:hypothetical protein KKE92_00470 [Candidatus Micrarchaeota archaeon]|nr:hypothetical protein [Candidatus Micrarchaeota archaeon]MBU1682103.1 hypothetical protein [Candidatus Micrarchaeota archaeon]
MRREILVILLMCTLVSAGLDQSYIHIVDREGNSEITKTMDISAFMTDFEDGSMENVSDLCSIDPELRCSVDGKVITITESFSPGEHYNFQVDYGIPFITYTLTQKKIPTDVFSVSLDKLLRKAGVIEGGVEGSADAIDLYNEEENKENAGFLRRFKVNLSYQITVPTTIDEARAGNVSGIVDGSTATFDIVDLMEESQPIVIKNSELNMGYLVIIAAVIILGGLAYSFFKSKPAVKKKTKKTKSKK